MLRRVGMLLLEDLLTDLLCTYSLEIQQHHRLYQAVATCLGSRVQICYQTFIQISIQILAISCHVHLKTHSLGCFHCVRPLYLLSLRLQRKRSGAMMDSTCSLQIIRQSSHVSMMMQEMVIDSEGFIASAFALSSDFSNASFSALSAELCDQTHEDT